MSGAAKALIDERGTTHGSFASNAHYGQTLRLLFRGSPHWDRMPAEHREALDMMACKLSRILSGQSTFPDHWRDISGYAELAADAKIGYDDRQQAELRTCTDCGGRWHMHHEKCAECRVKEKEG